MEKIETIEQALLNLYEEKKVLWGEYCYLKMLLDKRIVICREIANDVVCEICQEAVSNCHCSHPDIDSSLDKYVGPDKDYRDKGYEQWKLGHPELQDEHYPQEPGEVAKWQKEYEDKRIPGTHQP